MSQGGGSFWKTSRGEVRVTAAGDVRDIACNTMSGIVVFLGGGGVGAIHSRCLADTEPSRRHKHVGALEGGVADGAISSICVGFFGRFGRLCGGELVGCTATFSLLFILVKCRRR